MAGSAGEAFLMIGAILGHSNARSTQIYTHVSYDPARLAADRGTAPIAAAMGRALKSLDSGLETSTYEPFFDAR
jgi:hypothetical protein